MLSERQQNQLTAQFAMIDDAFDPAKSKARAAAFIGPRADWTAQKQISANIKARRDAEWEAARPARDARHASAMADLKLAQDESARIAREGNEYERACEAEFILNMKDCWSADDYAESRRITERKRNAAATLEVAA